MTSSFTDLCLGIPFGGVHQLHVAAVTTTSLRHRCPPSATPIDDKRSRKRLFLVFKAASIVIAMVQVGVSNLVDIQDLFQGYPRNLASPQVFPGPARLISRSCVIDIVNPVRLESFFDLDTWQQGVQRLVRDFMVIWDRQTLFSPGAVGQRYCLVGRERGRLVYFPCGRLGDGCAGRVIDIINHLDLPITKDDV